MSKCTLCGKGPVAGRNIPKSQHKTPRMFQPNIQSVDGVKMCTRCLRTLKRQVELATAPVAVA